MLSYPILVVCGSPGAGKSTVASALQVLLSHYLVRTVAWYRADSVRRDLFGDAPYHYSQSDAVYKRLLELGAEVSEPGVVILDGTFHSRRRAQAVTDKFAPRPVWFLYLKASEAKRTSNLERRGPDDPYGSLYTLEVHEVSTYVSPPFPLTCLCVNADLPLPQVIEDVWHHVMQIFRLDGCEKT